jgi:uncharacterized membrane protein HdeD (DUF308 family)
MEAERSALGRAESRMLVRGSARYWWVVLLAGIAWLLVAWVVLRADVRSLAAVGVLIGIVLVGAGVNEAALAAVMTRGWRFVHYGVAVLFVLAGIWAFIRPVNTFFALASVLGLILILEGGFEVARGVAARDENPYWWVGLVSGGLILLLGFWVSSSDRVFDLAARSALILLWVGFMALFRGISEIMLAFGLRRLGTAAAHAEAVGAADTADATATIPPQDRRAAPAPTSEGASRQ